jgi:hypothetical protein
MKKAKGKSNIDILKDYQAGVRPFTQVGYVGQPSVPSSSRKEGEIWEEKGKSWIKTAYGVRSHNPKADIIREEMDKMWICAKTGKNLKFSHTKYDKIALQKTGMCFDALIEYETDLRIKGLFKDYERKKILLNQISFLEDMKKKFKEGYEYTKSHKTFEYINSNGTVDVWENDSREELMANIRKDYKQCVRLLRQGKEELAKLTHIEICPRKI